MQILIVEDLSKEIKKAKGAAKDNGVKFIVTTNLKDALEMIETLSFDGIVTDLHFPEGYHNVEKGGEKPSGLAVIAKAIEKNIPVAICSDVDHHFAQYLEVVISWIRKQFNQKIYFGMDSKNWDAAIKSLKTKG